MNDLAQNLKAADIIKEYNAAKREIRAGYASLKRAKDRLSKLSDYTPRVIVGRADIDFMEEKVIADIEEMVWRQLIDVLGIKKILSQAKLRELDEQLHNHKFPKLTLENVYATVDSLMSQAEEFAAEAVREVYNWLRPRDSYKSNSEFEVGGRVVIQGVLSNCGREINYGRWGEDRLIALDKVFHLLDGKPFLSVAPYRGTPLVRAILAADAGETEYFRYKTYLNNNLHIWFLRDDLRIEFNRVAGGGSLRG